MQRLMIPVLLMLLATTPARSEEPNPLSRGWPQWRGPNRDAISPDKGIIKDWNERQPKLLWMTKGMGNGFAGVSVSGQRAYTTGNLDNAQAVICVNAADGSVLWTAPITEKQPQHGYNGSRCTPTVDGNRLYVVASSGAICCLNTADGSIVWNKDFRAEWEGRMMSGWGFSESPLVDGDRVLCTPGGPGAVLVALNKHDGSEIWRCSVSDFSEKVGRRGRPLSSGAGYSSIVVSQGAGVKQYVQLVGNGVIGVRADDGKFLWGYDGVANTTANIPTPVVSGDYVFCSTGYGTGSALLKLSRKETADDDADDTGGVQAEEVYFLDARTLQNKHGGMVLVDGYIYCGHGDGAGRPICVEMTTGRVAWGGKEPGPGRGEASVVYVDGHIIYRFQDGNVGLVAATPEEFRVEGAFMPAHQEGPSWAHPAVADGKLYLREQDVLMCYDLRESI